MQCFKDYNRKYLALSSEGKYDGFPEINVDITCSALKHLLNIHARM
jgi:hypothetical protein